jgi:O-methyltransferase involved in polyketide biosynthesis
MVDLEKVSLTGTQQTALVTLYGKALDSRRPDSILADREADKAVQRIDYDFSRLRVRRRDQKSAAVRAKAYDGWVTRFLNVHPECVVLHLGCGLDTRVYRVDPPSTVDWYDIDLPDVIRLRRRLFPQRPGLRTIAASVVDPGLLATIPAALPVLVVAEGLTPYLRASDGLAMLRRIVGHFPSGEMVFDGWSRAGVWLTQRYAPVKASGAELDWSIGDPRELEKAVPGLVFDCEWWFSDAKEIKRYYSPLYWQLMQVLFHITPIRRLGRGLRYRFGSARCGDV